MVKLMFPVDGISTLSTETNLDNSSDEAGLGQGGLGLRQNGLGLGKDGLFLRQNGLGLGQGGSRTSRVRTVCFCEAKWSSAYQGQ